MIPLKEGKQEMPEKVVELAEQLRRRINMTQLGQLYEKEKIEYGNQKTQEMALKMLRRNIDIMEVSGLTEAELLRLQDENVSV